MPVAGVTFALDLLTIVANPELVGKSVRDPVLMARNAVAATPANHPDLAMYLNNLGISLQDRYSRTGAIEVLRSELIKAI